MPWRWFLLTVLTSACRRSTGASDPTADAQTAMATSTIGAPATATDATDAAAPGRLVILGFDGVDPRRLAALLARGQLPTVRALAARGHLGPLATTNPPQSPVAWAAFATGQGAGQHGIFDFVARRADTYMPQVATTRLTHASQMGDVVTPARAENLRQGAAFWDVLARAGVSSRSITVPYAYPPPLDGAIALTGLGTPDARGTNASFTLLTNDPARLRQPPPAGGQIVALRPVAAGRWSGSLAGPPLRRDGVLVRPSAPLEVEQADDEVALTLGGRRLQLARGATSPMLSFALAASPQLGLQAAARVTLLSLKPYLALYVEPLNLVPAAPYLPLAQPPQYAVDLWALLGPNRTVGWLDDTSALGAGVIEEAQFLREAKSSFGWTLAAVEAALDSRRDRVLVAVFTAPDRIAHMFERLEDASHPAHDAALAGRFAGALDSSYAWMDGALERVVARLGPRDRLLVMSDHGFGSFRRGVNLNRWLLEHGYMYLRAGVQAPRDLFVDVDWSRTRAYAFGTGSIYLNRLGREGQGIVPAAAATALTVQIRRELLALRDGARPVVAAVYLGDDLFAGPQRDAAPDLRVALVDGYRASWATAMGGMPATVFEDNLKRWSGDHASARPEDVPGILLSSHPIRRRSPRIEDLAATAYDVCGVSAPAGGLGQSLYQDGP